MITPILILHGKLTTAIALKQALERSPRCEVHPFTTPDAAIEYAREHTQDAALIDLVTLGGSAAAAAIDALRSVQPAILIVVMPPPGDEQMRALAADAALPSDFRPADLLRLIDNWLKRRTTPMSAVEPGQPGKSGLLEHIFDDDLPPPPDTLPEQPATLEGVLQQMGHDGFGYPPAPEDSSRDNYYDAIEDVTYDEGATPNDPQSSAPNAGAPRQPRTDFDALVESLRREPPPVGSRMADFIIRGGADIVLGYDDPIAPTRPEIDRRARPAQYSDTAMRLHRRLAQDEPPMPGAAEGGTISDLISGVHDKGFERVLSILRGDSVLDESSEIIVGRPIHPDAAFEFAPAIMTIDPPPRPRESFDFDAVPQAESPARVMLEQTLEQSMSLGEFSIEDLLDSIEQRLPETRIKPLPPHVRQNAEQRWRAARQAAEMAEAAAVPSDPADLPEGMSSDQTTRASQAQHFESRPDLLETEWIDAPVVGIDATRAVTTVQDASARALPDDAATPPDTLPELSDLAVVAPRPFETPHDASANLERGEGADWGEWYTEDFNTQFELMAAFDLPAPRVSVVPSVPSAPAAPFSPPAAAVLPPTPAANVAPPTSEQVALTLTHAALETTAEAALLLRKGEIVAQAGRTADAATEHPRRPPDRTPRCARAVRHAAGYGTRLSAVHLHDRGGYADADFQRRDLDERHSASRHAAGRGVERRPGTGSDARAAVRPRPAGRDRTARAVRLCLAAARPRSPAGRSSVKSDRRGYGDAAPRKRLATARSSGQGGLCLPVRRCARR